MTIRKRVRDPVHGLIVFDFDFTRTEVDKVVWRLIDSPEFQRLRRIKQLGVSEFTFPGATHTRFAHSIGVFHVARRLMKIAEKGIALDQHKPHRARTALISALLHDLGHGPFSHAFEIAEEARLKEHPGKYKNHERWTAEIIASQNLSIRQILEDEYGGSGSIADDIAKLLTNDPTDIYAAVVSSSFDADRLDYLQRDRTMSGSGAGAIDFEWLIDNLRVVTVQTAPEDGDNGSTETVQTFAFEEKALQAVEAFILARYHLYSQVYMHRATRGIEQTLTAFLAALSKSIADGESSKLPINKHHPLIAYYEAENPNLDLYLKLDDSVVWSAIVACADAAPAHINQLAIRLRDRKLLKAVTIDMVNPTRTDRARRKHIDEELGAEIGKTILIDRAPLSIYKDSRREIVKPHKRVHVRRADGSVVDIASLSRPVAALAEGEEILRYYFVNESVRQSVLQIQG